MKQKSPSFQFYPKQWLGDDKVMLMDWDARGMHMELICIAWQQEKPGTLPNEEIIIRRWLKNPSEKVWARVWPQIKSAWKISQKNPLKLHSRSLLRELKKQRNFSRVQTENAYKRWTDRRKNFDAMALPSHQNGNARAGNARAGYALQSSASAVLPNSPQSGPSASPRVNGTNPRARGTNPRALGTNPRAVKARAVNEATQRNRYRDPVIPESERMTAEEMASIRRKNLKHPAKLPEGAVNETS